ncbi:cytochrome c [Chitinophagaceae bacterium LB-8]|uniref:Cytochrome c n=1 Tax=Paraflavisolibacter caeni TaxID=2982496 RepID=A0A9X3BI09_9BACT|nr:cytochrome c [Paraflavisolibacter caeni]MCU7549473.1 cytochrome c [Paraflavisolibacter caeni]
MNRKSTLFSLLTFATILITSCSKDNEQDEAQNQNPSGGGNGGSTCDTVNIKYATGVVPILQANCYVCHGNGSAEGSVTLDNYNALKTKANNGTLLGVITHAAGYPQMPKNGAKLSDCNINKIRSWINNGAQNN